MSGDAFDKRADLVNNTLLWATFLGHNRVNLQFEVRNVF